MSVAELYQSLEYGPAPEAAEPAHGWIEAHGGKFANFIGNQWIDPTEGEYFETVNPATAQPLARVAQSSQNDVDRAVTAARGAAPDWAALPGHGRARYLYAIARHIQKTSRLLAVLESLDNGKSIRETRDIDIPLVARHFYYHAGWAQLMEEELKGYEPVGVVGQIIPWNFPLLMLAWKIAPAIAMGNTVVLKPAEFTPLSALAFAEIVGQIGLPPGVVNIITGDGHTGELLVNAPVDKIAFTGSTEVGRAIRRATAGTGKRLSLELGGKSPFVVFDDADLDSVVEGVVDAIWFNQGQVCCAGSRLLVQESIEEALIAKLRARMETLRMGDPLDKAIDIGAIIAPVQLQRIESLVRQGIEDGATAWQPSWACPSEGFFYPPTLFTNVSPSATIAQVEIFGPVLVSMTFRTPAEAVALANNTRYGLAASVWSENINLALDIARQIKAGSVWINCTNMFDAASGFGGYRESGYGREGGREGLYEYVKVQGSRFKVQGSKSEVQGSAAESSTFNVRRSTAGVQSSEIESSTFNVQRSTAGVESSQSESSTFNVQRSTAGIEGLEASTENRDDDALAAAASAFPSDPDLDDGRGALYPPAVVLPQSLYGADVRLDGGYTDGGLPPIDRTPKQYIGGKQTRPDSGYSLSVSDSRGAAIGEVGEGNRKDVRDAVEAAHKAAAWMWSTAHARAQVLYYVAENLQARGAEFARRIDLQVGGRDGALEVERTIDRLFTFAAWTDKYDGEVHQTPFRNMTIAVNEAIGVVAVVCPRESPLLGFVTPVAAAVAMGNTVVAVPSESHPLSATDLYQVLDTSDLPGGVVNIVTGARPDLVPVLAAHDDVDAMWCWAGRDLCRDVECQAAGNMKRTWTNWGPYNWEGLDGEEMREFLRESTQVKNIWTPYGE